ALAVAAALVLAIVLTRGSTSAIPQHALTAEASLSRSGALFADPLRASIEVLVDRKRIDPARVGFSVGFEPFSRIGIPRLSRHDTDRLTRLVFTTDIVCSTDVCLPKGRSNSMRIRFTPAQVFYFPRDGSGRRTVNLPWQPLTLATRTTAADLAGDDPFSQPIWHASTDPLAVSYRFSPSALKIVLLVISGLLFAGAAFALWRMLRALQARLRLPLPSALERAVRLVERTEAREDAAAKRKALELLSRELTRSGESQLALAARELAWAEPTPIPATTQPLTLDVRRLIQQRSNGHGA
ncbi:MAG: hypothetical protein QOF27_3087, partial [Gaiellaceae bacterium]|nr:hypothetical protein [Gaiellaceae bacterium]